MPSDAKKKQQQKKKEAAKARQSGKKQQSNNQKAAEDGKEQSPTSGDLQNGTNGTAISVEGERRRSVPFAFSIRARSCALPVHFSIFKRRITADVLDRDPTNENSKIILFPRL